MSILLSCHRCGNEMESKDSHWGLCGRCYARDLINSYRPEILRLVRKRSRYAASGISIVPVDHQLGALCNRAERKARDAAPALASEIRSALGEAIQDGLVIIRV